MRPTESTSDKQRLRVVERCGNRCEASIKLGNAWTRCFRSPVEVHHGLTRARGGDLLDQAGDDYHLIGLCLQHHRSAHSDGYGNGMMIEGYVLLDSATSKVYYSGPDEYLTETYPDPRKEPQ